MKIPKLLSVILAAVICAVSFAACANGGATPAPGTSSDAAGGEARTTENATETEAPKTPEILDNFDFLADDFLPCAAELVGYDPATVEHILTPELTQAIAEGVNKLLDRYNKVTVIDGRTFEVTRLSDEDYARLRSDGLDFSSAEDQELYQRMCSHVCQFNWTFRQLVAAYAQPGSGYTYIPTVTGNFKPRIVNYLICDLANSSVANDSFMEAYEKMSGKTADFDFIRYEDAGHISYYDAETKEFTTIYPFGDDLGALENLENKYGAYVPVIDTVLADTRWDGTWDDEENPYYRDLTKMLNENPIYSQFENPSETSGD